jgi:peptidoglycan hydrolase-like protein with peptidoglycan-binding domain
MCRQPLGPAPMVRVGTARAARLGRPRFQLRKGTTMRIRDAAMALAPTAFLAAPALAQSNLSGSKANNQATNPAYSQQGTNQVNGELSHQDVKQIQSRLQQEGLYHGNIDGIWGPKTQSAVGDFQQQHGLRDTGHANSQTLADLGVNQQLGGNQPAMQGPGTGSTSAGPNAMSGTNSSRTLRRRSNRHCEVDNAARALSRAQRSD